MKKPQIFINSITSRFYTSTKYSVRVFYLFIAICIFFLASCENPFMEEILGLKTITFDTNGGGYIPEQKLLRGEKIFKPADPAKNGYDFCGWFEDNGTFHNKWNFNTAPEKTMTLYAKWEAVPDETIIYTLKLDTAGLTNDWDSVSFSESDDVLETTAFNGDIITVYYTLTDVQINNWFAVYVNGNEKHDTLTPGAGSFSYTVNHSDADNGVITIHAHSAHSNLFLLLPLTSVHFDKTGTINFSAHPSNPQGTTYCYTLYHNDAQVAGFIDQIISSGAAPGIVNRMLQDPGKYHVEAWAKTDNPSYEHISDSIESEPVFVYEVSVTIKDAESGETITIKKNGTQVSGTTIFNVFGGDTVTLTASPAGTDRKVTWRGGGTIDYNTYTVTVTGTTNITAKFMKKQMVVAASNFHTMAIKTDGTLWAWGRNNYGQLGNGTTTDSHIPIRIGTDTNWESVSAGGTSATGSHTIAIKTDGTLWAWGQNNYGQLGDGKTTDSHIPIRIGTDNTWESVSAGATHTMAIKADGTLWAWGQNSSGQLGDGTSGNDNSKTSPVQIGDDSDWKSVSAGSYYTVAIKTDGTLWAWGYNNYGQLGDGTTIASSSPVPIGDDFDWKSVSAGNNHTMAIKTDGTLWAWGLNIFGQLGNGSTIDSSIPVPIGDASDWKSVSAGNSHTMAIKADGTLWAWGVNIFGQLGNGTQDNESSPVKIGYDSDKWESVSAGLWHTTAIQANGTFWAWGQNNYGQLGNGETTDSHDPVEIDF